jgi:hypothetical protein
MRVWLLGDGEAFASDRGLSRQGSALYEDREMASRLTAEGFRSARSARVSVALIRESQQARGQLSLTEQCKIQAQLGPSIDQKISRGS